MKPGWLSSEFFANLAALAGKIIVLLVGVHLIHTADPAALTQQISDVILAVGALITISYGSANYTNNRTQLKSQLLAQTAPK